MVHEFADRVRWISGRDDTTSVMRSPCYSRSIDTVLSEEGEDVGFLEGESSGGQEVGAEEEGRLVESSVGVMAAGEGVEVDDCGYVLVSRSEGIIRCEM